MMKPFSLLILSLCLASNVSAQSVTAEAPPKQEAAKETSDYIRYLETEEGPDLLQTAITRFRKGADTVDLVAVVHVGDAAYYEGLNDYLKHFDFVLYEMVGGKFEEQGREEAADSTAPEMESVRQLQLMAKSFLGLEFQLDGINYEAGNFVHADVDWDDYQRLMDAKNQNLATLFTRAMNLSQTGQIPGVPGDEAGMNLLLGQLMAAITSGDTNGLKRTVAPLLSEAEGFISMLEGEDGTVIVTERNKVVMKKFAEVRAKKAGGKYAVFYGAGHMPDLEERLLADGFQKIEEGWADAWTMPKPTAENSLSSGETPPSATDFLLRMLQENPEFMSAVEQLGEVLEQLQTPPE